MPNRLGQGNQPLPAPARPQPRGLVSLGRGGVREGAEGGQADLPVDRLLAPATGATSWSASRSRTRRSPKILNEHFVLHQGGSRGAAGRRPHLHDVRAGDHRQRRLADVGVADAGSEAVLRRHIFSAGEPLRAARAFATFCEQLAHGLADGPRAASSQSGDEVLDATAEARQRSERRAEPVLDEAVLDDRLLRSSAARFDSRSAASAAPRNFRGRRPQFSAALFTRDRRTTKPLEMVLHHAARDGQGRHERSARRRLPPLLGGRAVVRAALREDALRPGAARRSYSKRFRSRATPEYAAIARRHLRLRVARHDRSPTGGFYSAEDADSVIDPRIRTKRAKARSTSGRRRDRRAAREPAADGSASATACSRRQCRDDPQQEFTGKNILYQRDTLRRPPQQFRRTGGRGAQAREASEAARARGDRVRPHLDDKVLTAWNGLMISAFARAAPCSASRAIWRRREAADFMITKQLLERRRRCCGATARATRRYPGFLDDYASFTQACSTVRG